ncbi:J domain-containing protein [Kribbella sp. NPDC054772]
MSGSDHYEVLNVERTATTAEIKSAYRKLVRQVHPDQGGSAALFRVVQEAWTTLGDDHRRAAYDRELAGKSGAASEPPPYEPPRYEPPRHDPPSYEPPRAEPQEDTTAPEVPFEPVGLLSAVPRFGRWRVVAIVLPLAWLIVVTGPLVIAAVTNPEYLLYTLPLLCLGVAGLPRQWRFRIPFGRLMNRFGILVAVAFLATLVIAYSHLDTTTRVLLFALLGGFLLVRLVGWRRSIALDLDRAVDKYAAYEANIWGRPGEPLVDDGYSTPLPPSEVLRTRRTALLLERVLTVPSAKLIHAPRIGGLTVDHLLLAGSRVAVVASVVGPPGAYSVDAYGSVLRNGQPFGGAPALTDGMSAWERFLKGTQVRGFLVVLPVSDGQSGITTVSAPDAAVACLSPQAAVAEITAWLQPEGNIVDRRLLYGVLYDAPLAQG